MRSRLVVLFDVEEAEIETRIPSSAHEVLDLLQFTSPPSDVKKTSIFICHLERID